MIALTETWLKEHGSNQEYSTDVFGQPIQLDRDTQLTAEAEGGGVCLWCKTVITQSCSPHIELLSVSLHPFY